MPEGFSVCRVVGGQRNAPGFYIENDERAGKMDNIFTAGMDSKKSFTWGDIGDIKAGRGDLGEEMPVVLYRLMQFTMVDAIASELGTKKANEFLYKAGYLAGVEFAKNVLDTTLEFNLFIAHLQEMLKELKIGILRMEYFNSDTGEMTLTVAEDLDCSGLPITGEAVCVYDEGFIAGILRVYTGRDYVVKEIDCWATGDRVCRFKAAIAQSE